VIALALSALLLLPPAQGSGLAGAAARLREGRGEEALTLALAAVEKDPRNLDALNSAGFIAEASGRSEQAQALFERAHVMDPSAIYPLQMLGAIAFDQGRLEESESYYRAALEMAPRDENLERDLGSILERKQTMARFAEARSRLRGALIGTVLGWLLIAGAIAFLMRRHPSARPVARP
jgi:tetratricopeptide (TPR) repeat protein